MKQILKWCTVVGPDEYDLDKQIDEIIKIANKEHAKPNSDNPYLPIDVGKFVGLYLAWKELKEKKCQTKRNLR